MLSLALFAMNFKELTFCGHPAESKRTLDIINFRKDARLPENLQRAMAAEAEAAREARAKVNFHETHNF